MINQCAEADLMEIEGNMIKPRFTDAQNAINPLSDDNGQTKPNLKQLPTTYLILIKLRKCLLNGGKRGGKKEKIVLNSVFSSYRDVFRKHSLRRSSNWPYTCRLQFIFQLSEYPCNNTYNILFLIYRGYL